MSDALTMKMDGLTKWELHGVVDVVRNGVVWLSLSRQQRDGVCLGDRESLVGRAGEEQR